MSKVFKVGDKVVCTDNSDGYRDVLTIGKEYVVLPDSYAEFVAVTSDLGILSVGYDERFKLATVTNGVNAEGQPSYFDISQLKSWMRVKTAAQGFYIVSECDGTTILIHTDGWFSACQATQEWEILEVYNPPKTACQMLDENKYGRLIWKKSPPKTAEQLAQEAAAAARNVAVDSAIATIEEAEKALKSAQDKLAALKNI